MTHASGVLQRRLITQIASIEFVTYAAAGSSTLVSEEGAHQIGLLTSQSHFLLLKLVLHLPHQA